MKRTQSGYSMGSYRIRHCAAETVGGWRIGEHFAVFVLTADGWRRVANLPDREAAEAEIAARRVKRVAA